MGAAAIPAQNPKHSLARKGLKPAPWAGAPCGGREVRSGLFFLFFLSSLLKVRMERAIMMALAGKATYGAPPTQAGIGGHMVGRRAAPSFFSCRPNRLLQSQAIRAML